MKTTISTAELADRLGDPALTVVDVRPLAAYNGWRLGGTVRGGHIPGAVAFPAAWLGSGDDAEIDRLLDEKGVRAGRSVVVYGYDTDDALDAEHGLRSRGITGTRVLAGGAQAWAADPALPLDRLPNHDKLVHVDWLREVLDGGRPESAPEGRFLLFHVDFGAPDEYAEGHIPGAHYLDTDWLEDPTDRNRRPPNALEAALHGLGITHDTTVLLYGRDTEGHASEKRPGRRAGQLAATRALTILRYAGVDDVRLLDGGYDRWVRDGNPLETDVRDPELVGAFGVTVPRRPEIIVDLAEARRMLADPAAALVSVRSWREQIGEVSGYDYIGPAGRIKGDVWGNGGTDAYHMQHYRNVDNTMRAYPEIAAGWREAGITPDKSVAFYCGTGWRASEAWFCAYLQGWQRIAVYDGGWFEWSQDPVNNPIAIGQPDGPFRGVS